MTAPSNATAAAKATPLSWTTFKNRGGWSIDYPHGWAVSSCHVCRDPAAPGISVSFTGPRDDDFVMVEPLADKPAAQTAAQWLNEIAATANLNTIVEKHPASLDGHFALVVRYRFADGTPWDEIYVADGNRTFQIGPLPTQAPSLPVLRHMVATFKTRPVKPGH